jgi:hypothetical protein
MTGKKWMVIGAVLALGVVTAIGAVVVREKVTLKDVEEAQEPLKEETQKRIGLFCQDLSNAQVDWRPLRNISNFLYCLLTNQLAKLDVKIDMKVTNSQAWDVDITNLCIQVLVEEKIIEHIDKPSLYIRTGESQVFTISLTKDKFFKKVTDGINGVRLLAKSCNKDYDGEVKITVRCRATGWSKQVFSIRQTIWEKVEYVMMPGKDGLQYSFSWGDPNKRVRSRLKRLNDVKNPLFWTASPQSTVKLSCTVKNLTRQQRIKEKIEPRIHQAARIWFDDCKKLLAAELIDLGPGETKSYSWSFELEKLNKKNQKRVEDWKNPYLFPVLENFHKGTWNHILLWVKK